MELVSAWASISPEEQFEALLGQRALVNELEPGLWEQLRNQRKAQEQAAKEQRKAELEAAKLEVAKAKAAEKQARKAVSELARRQRSIPVEIRKIQRSLKGHAYRDERQHKKLEKVQDKLTKMIIKQIREDHV